MMVCKRQEQCAFGEKCVYHVGSVLPKCNIFEQKSPIKQTEQEYIQTCNTEQLVDAIYECVMANSWSFSKDGIKRWLEQPHKEKMKDYRVEQVTKYLLRYMHRGGRKFKRFKLDRRKFKEWLKNSYTERDME